MLSIPDSKVSVIGDCRTRELGNDDDTIYIDATGDCYGQ